MPNEQAPGPFHYSDSDEAEERLLRIVRGAGDRSTSSPELVSKISDWVSYYHLSPQRCDLLRPLKPLLRGSVLEVGAGCGAVTRWLGETAGRVVAVEGSPRRAEIARARCEGLASVEVVTGNFEGLESGERFDCVTCIGVIEYSARYLSGPDPWGAMIRRMTGFLKPGGALVIAIENRLGLKYFAGAPEDHTGRPFDGVQDLYEPGGVRTLGRGEWQSLLRRSGMADQCWLYPFPDYKHASLVLSGNALDRIPDEVEDLLRDYPAPNQNLDYGRAFSEESAWPVLVRNRLVPELANSFLILARREEERGAGWMPRALFYKYSTNRVPAYAKELRVETRGSEVAAVRERIYPDVPEDPAWALVTGATPFRPGRLYTAGLLPLMNREGWKAADILSWATPWLELLRSRSTPAPELPGGAALPPEFVDCVPFNVLVEPDGALQAFDLEYKASAPLPIGHVAFRGLWGTLAKIRSCAAPGGGEALALCELSFGILEAGGIPLDAAARADVLRREADLRQAILGITEAAAMESLLSAHLRVRGATLGMVSGNALCQVYWRAGDEVFHESNSASRFAALSGERQTMELPIPPAGKPYRELRFDPADLPCLIEVFRVRLTAASGEAILPRRPSDSLFDDPRNVGFLQIARNSGDGRVLLLARNNDPICHLPLDAHQGAALQAGGVLEVSAAFSPESTALPRTVELLSHAGTELSRRAAQATELAARLSSLSGEAAALEEESARLCQRARDEGPTLVRLRASNDELTRSLLAAAAGMAEQRDSVYASGQDLTGVSERLAEKRKAMAELRAELSRWRATSRSLEEDLRLLREKAAAIENLLTTRVARPFRRIEERLRGAR